jgi:pseudolysin/vibriolysin
MVDVFTDGFPRETSWTLINTCTGVAQESIVAGTKYQDSKTQYSDTYTVPPAEYRFEIRDAFGDGICCSHGNGSYSVTYNGKVEVSGGDFKFLETSTFGSCGPETTPGPWYSRGTDENVTGSVKILAEAEVQ